MKVESCLLLSARLIISVCLSYLGEECKNDLCRQYYSLSALPFSQYYSLSALLVYHFSHFSLSLESEGGKCWIIIPIYFCLDWLLGLLIGLFRNTSLVSLRNPSFNIMPYMTLYLNSKISTLQTWFADVINIHIKDVINNNSLGDLLSLDKYHHLEIAKRTQWLTFVFVMRLRWSDRPCQEKCQRTLADTDIWWSFTAGVTPVVSPVVRAVSPPEYEVQAGGAPPATLLLYLSSPRPPSRNGEVSIALQ